MAITNEIERLQNAKSNLKNAINSKLKVEQNKISNELISDYSGFVDNIQTGDGDISNYFLTNNITVSNMNLGNYIIKKIPELDLTGTTSLRYAFSNFINLEELSLIHTNGVESMESCFRECHKIKNIPLFDTSNIVNLDAAFSNCFRLETIPPFNVSKVTNMSYAFSSCYVLKTIPELDTGKVENFKRTFDRCFRLISLPKLDFKSANNISSMFVTYTTNTELTTLGGFENLGQAYLETQRAHFVDYTLELQYLTKLTEQSLINVLTNVYDIASKGVETQQIILGADNLAKLTSEEGQQALTRATNYGWTIS